VSFSRRVRRLKAQDVTRYTCRCGRMIIIYKGKSDKVSHETPICDWFRLMLAEVGLKHGCTTEQGATYVAALIIPEKGNP
jgi:hypothetical protein